MEITRVPRAVLVPRFGELKTGDVFELVDLTTGRVFMKTGSTNDFNAIWLSDNCGVVCHMDDHEKVRLLDVELRVS